MRTLMYAFDITTAVRGAVEQCASLYTVQRQVFLTKNLRLLNTTAIRGGSGENKVMETVRRLKFLYNC